ncbi:MAG: hypothetical protein Edafosvirus11_31 [Edafosvirus sp.]|uniref:Uncharacterized protein n=1 Tax=Edafosvirus sp. TaxID=2487765 RepID=A0A3G4ZU08_9VIRU|nr:MAG: hypothetical protein Edafosvirus11_31 [Edafosvirus sp.]
MTKASNISMLTDKWKSVIDYDEKKNKVNITPIGEQYLENYKEINRVLDVLDLYKSMRAFRVNDQLTQYYLDKWHYHIRFDWKKKRIHISDKGYDIITDCEEINLVYKTLHECELEAPRVITIRRNIPIVKPQIHL